MVSSNATSLPEVNGDAAVYFDPLSVDDMAAKIQEVLTKPDLRKHMIARGHKQVAKYSWQKTAEQTLAIYKRVLGES